MGKRAVIYVQPRGALGDNTPAVASRGVAELELKLPRFGGALQAFDGGSTHPENTLRLRPRVSSTDGRSGSCRTFEPSSHSIRHWVRVADRRDRGGEAKAETVSPAERDELAKLRREVSNCV